MVLASINFKTKNNYEIELRSPQAIEAQSILDSLVEIAKFSPHILSTPECFKARTVESQIKWIEDAAPSDDAILIAAYSQGKIIGFCDGRSYKDIKRKHRAALGVSLHPDFRGVGLGKKLMEILIENMKKFSGIKIIELDVMSSNIIAIKLYESLGFQRCGVFPNAFIFPSGETSDNITMYLNV